MEKKTVYVSVKVAKDETPPCFYLDKYVHDKARWVPQGYLKPSELYILTEEQMKAVERLVFVLEHFREYYLATEALADYNKQFK